MKGAWGILLILLAGGEVRAQNAPAMPLDTGKQIFDAACNGCHGPGGKGQPQTTLGFEPPDTFPDFTDCNGSSRERVADWRATIHEGGSPRGFSEIMPSFAEALTREQIGKVADYLRSLCSEPAWPRGELNLPRGFLTEKAFPEDEWVLSTSATRRTVGNELSYEKRFGAKTQLELAFPANFAKRENKDWIGGIGDFVIGLKRVLAFGQNTILSVQGEVAAPTGNRQQGLGAGLTTFETFAAFGQILPGDSFFQFQGGFELPVSTENVSSAAFGHFNFGKTLKANKGWGREWIPMVEFAADRDLESGAKINWDIAPQMQVALNKRQHIRASAGYQIPLNNTSGRSKQVVFYILWDWFDGGIRDGWK